MSLLQMREKKIYKDRFKQMFASQQRTVDMQSPFARPGSRAGTCTTPASDGGMLPKASNPFTRPDSRAGSARRNLHPHSRQYHLRATNQLREDANTSVSWDLVDTDTDAEVANINSSLLHQTVTDQHSQVQPTQHETMLLV